MRKLFLLGALALLLALPATSQADRPPSAGKKEQLQDGCLVVSGANGVVQIWAEGALIGRIEQGGTITVDDLNPADTSRPRVFGDDTRIVVSRSRTQYSGLSNVRFRFTGGGPYHVVVQGIGIDLSAVGQGRALLNGSRYVQQGGTYSADENSLCGSDVKPFPEFPTRVVLGAPATG